MCRSAPSALLRSTVWDSWDPYWKKYGGLVFWGYIWRIVGVPKSQSHEYLFYICGGAALSAFRLELTVGTRDPGLFCSLCFSVILNVSVLWDLCTEGVCFCLFYTMVSCRTKFFTLVFVRFHYVLLLFYVIFIILIYKIVPKSHESSKGRRNLEAYAARRNCRNDIEGTGTLGPSGPLGVFDKNELSDGYG